MNQPVGNKPTARKRLGALLLEEGAITEDQLRIGLREQQTNRKPLGSILIDLGFVTDSIVFGSRRAVDASRS